MRFLTGAAIGAIFLAGAAGAQTGTTGMQTGTTGMQAGTTGAQAGTTATGGAAAQTTPAQAGAMTSAAPTVGATVYDSTGAVLGTVEQVTPQAVFVNASGTKVGLPPSAIGAGPQGLRVATTRADILTQAQQATAAQKAQLTAGTTVRGSGGASVGTIKSVDGEFVTLTTSKGDVKLPANAVAAGPNGATIAMTAAQLDAAITAAGGAAPTQGAGTAKAGATTESTTAADADTTAETTAATGGTAAKSTTSTTKKSMRKTTRRTTR